MGRRTARLLDCARRDLGPSAPRVGGSGLGGIRRIDAEGVGPVKAAPGAENRCDLTGCQRTWNYRLQRGFPGEDGIIQGRNVMQRCILHFIDWIRAMSDDALVDAAQEIAEMRPLTDTEDRKG